MCGFVGFIGGMETQNNPAIIKKMSDRIIHRGPDDADFYVDEDISLAFRRLSIIDLEGGRQPLFNEDKSLVLMFNGEIYNYQTIRKELIEKGHIFTTKTDSEVLVHGYEEWGTELLKRLRGMFAFIIWNKNTKELFGARDFFGIKPFYFGKMKNKSGETLMFGSEIKSFLDHPHFKKELNTEALENYLTFQYSALDESFFKNVYKLKPAHYFKYKNGNFITERYWEPKFNASNEKSLEEYTDEIEKVFDDSILAHKISDVEVGSFLSSGVDSSYVAASANVDKTFTVGFDYGEKYNEISYAKELSEQIGVKNISKTITTEEFWDNFKKIQYHMDEPLADPSAVALYFVCNTASKHLKVALSGEGADELFGGYNIYKEPLDLTAYDKIPFIFRRIIGKIAEYLPQKRGINYIVRRGKTLEERFIGNAYMFTERERKKLLKIKTDARKPKDIVAPIYAKVEGKDPVTKMQYVDIHAWMIGDILLKADKMSMANSLEVRVPFLDKEIMKVAEQLPLEYRVNNENTKFAMRKAALRRLPPKWADKKKLGFPIPTREWIKEDKYFKLLESAFTNDVAKSFFNTEILIKMLQNHKDLKEDNSRKLWTVYTFLVWYERFFIDEK